MRRLSNCFGLVLATLLFVSWSGSTCRSEDNELPWEESFSSAMEKAKKEKRPIFLMMTATWCGPCKMLESKTLPDRHVRDGMKDFVWVQAFEEKDVEAKYGLTGYPTLVFIDPEQDRVIHKTVGYQTVGPFLKNVIQARKSGELPLSKELERLASKIFVPDQGKIKSLVNEGDLEGLKEYLSPVNDDVLRDSNYLVARINVPNDLSKDRVLVTGPRGELPVSESGIVLASVPKDADASSMHILAPGCKVLEPKIKFPKGSAVQTREITLRPLAKKDSITFSGRVLLPNGSPAAKAIVRICDWEVTRADAQGRFQFKKLSPGTFLVRAEYPGGEFHQQIKFEPDTPAKQDLTLAPVATVGIRWSLQTKEGSKDLVGSDVQSGEAYFSVRHSRFSLERGAEVRSGFGSDFMMRDSVQGLDKALRPEQLNRIQAAGDAAIFFWLFDVGRHPAGLHLESSSFESIESVEPGSDPRKYFQFLRGELVEPGQVYTVRCVKKDLYAKIEIISVSKALK